MTAELAAWILNLSLHTAHLTALGPLSMYQYHVSSVEDYLRFLTQLNRLLSFVTFCPLDMATVRIRLFASKVKMAFMILESQVA